MGWITGQSVSVTGQHFLTYRAEQSSTADGTYWIRRVPYPILMVRDEGDQVIQAFEPHMLLGAVAAPSGRNTIGGVDDHADAAARRLKLALDLFSAGEALMRERLRREHPDWPEAQIQRQLADWLRERPGAEFGDSPGSPVAWPRRQSGSTQVPLPPE